VNHLYFRHQPLSISNQIWGLNDFLPPKISRKKYQVLVHHYKLEQVNQHG